MPMRADTPDCLRCRRRMAPGYLLEAGHHDVPRVTQWVEGAPEKSRWRGLKLKDRQVLQVVTYRCPHCGYLESYAGGTTPNTPPG
jgi:hypothetical protein